VVGSFGVLNRFPAANHHRNRINDFTSSEKVVRRRRQEIIRRGALFKKFVEANPPRVPAGCSRAEYNRIMKYEEHLIEWMAEMIREGCYIQRVTCDEASAMLKEHMAWSVTLP
jgi:hypothetical protein